MSYLNLLRLLVFVSGVTNCILAAALWVTQQSRKDWKARAELALQPTGALAALIDSGRISSKPRGGMSMGPRDEEGTNPPVKGEQVAWADRCNRPMSSAPGEVCQRRYGHTGPHWVNPPGTIGEVENGMPKYTGFTAGGEPVTWKDELEAQRKAPLPGTNPAYDLYVGQNGHKAARMAFALDESPED